MHTKIMQEVIIMAQTNPQFTVNSNNVVWIYLSYILGWLFGLIGLAVVKDDDFVRFHCAQALVFSAIVFIVNMILSITVIFSILAFFIWIGAFVYGIILAMKAAKGEKVRIPFCGDFAEKNLMNLFK